MNKSIKKILLLVIILCVGVALFFVFKSRDVARPVNSEITKVSLEGDVSSEELITISFDVLQGLSFYYLASADTRLGNDDFLTIMTELMNDNRHLVSGNSIVEKYINHPNRVINLTAKGMILGSHGVIKANDNLLQFLRELDQKTPSTSEFEYQMATFLSSQKEGYSFITMSAPQITSLMFKPAESDNPKGAIPYTISKEQRIVLLKEIERLFGNELKEEKINAQKTGQHNAVLVAVQAIQNNLLSDNYEDVIN